jgi:dTDP-4-dehydrorhamnose reductase
MPRSSAARPSISAAPSRCGDRSRWRDRRSSSTPPPSPAVGQAKTARETAFAINRDGPAALAEACGDSGASLIHLSTDYVFDGENPAAYTEADPVNPLSVYGASNAAGESAVRQRLALAQHVILRTSWVYSPVGQNFVRTMLRLGAERERLQVVDDQQGCPTSAADIARAIVAVADALLGGRADGYGTFHFCGGGSTGWVRAGNLQWRRATRRPGVLAPISSEHYPAAARRPRRSMLDCTKIRDSYGIVARPWVLALGDCLDRLLGAPSIPAPPSLAG